jgi:hypothetical protein
MKSTYLEASKSFSAGQLDEDPSTARREAVLPAGNRRTCRRREVDRAARGNVTEASKTVKLSLVIAYAEVC